MLVAALLVALRPAYPTGVPNCGTGSPTSPGYPAVSASDQSPSIVCKPGASSCTVSLVSGDEFRGYAVTAKGATVNGRTCFAHTSKFRGTSVSFSVATSSPNAVIYATLVLKHTSAGHLYVNGEQRLRPPTATLYIIGAGPGGLGAARYAASQNARVVVYERGPQPWLKFYDQSIHNTYLNTLLQKTASNGESYAFNPLPKLTQSQMVQIVGGVQNANGAVFKPGSAIDLALSLGIPLQEASVAQELANDMVPHTNDMMWECIDETDCDYSSVAAYNTKMSRRSAAYNLPLDVSSNIHTSKPVSRVTTSRIDFEDGTHVKLNAGDAVVLAAGALASPQLLNRKVDSALNHYFKAEPSTQTPPDKQTFEYPSPGVEINTAAIDPTTTITITMDMNLGQHRESYTGGVYTPPAQFAGMAQAWHFHGTMPHDASMRVLSNNNTPMDNIYTGDAGALMRSFNCHTSMPAVAAGVAAARAWMGQGVAPSPPIVLSSPRPDHIPALFIFGSALLLIGVAFHVAARAYPEKGPSETGVSTKKVFGGLHYVLMTASVAVLWAAAIAVKTSDNPRASSSLHRILGYTLLGLLTAQALFGYALLYLKKTRGKEPYRLLKYKRYAHRVFGWTFLTIVILMWATSSRGLTVYEMKGSHERVANYSVIYALCLGAIVVFAFYANITRETRRVKLVRDDMALNLM